MTFSKPVLSFTIICEYDVAKKFLLSLRDDINTHHKINTIKFVIVPGNHDCVLNTPNDIRDALLVTCNKDDINEAIVNECKKYKINSGHFTNL